MSAMTAITGYADVCPYASVHHELLKVARPIWPLLSSNGSMLSN